MKNFYTWTAQPVKRSTSIAELQAKKGKIKSVQVTANTAEEAAAAAEADFDMIICNSKNVEAVRSGDNTRFLTASIPLPDLPPQMIFCAKPFVPWGQEQMQS